jgi:hypothetical protein
MARRYLKALFSLVCLLAFAHWSNAQTPAPTPTVVLPDQQKPQMVVGRSGLFCAGFIRHQRLAPMPEIVGGEEEQEQQKYSDGDIVYLNAGSKSGIQEGQTFQIIRPRGEVKGVHKQKHGSVGTYIQDIGQLQVFKVSENTSAAQVTLTCDHVMLGDLITPVPDRESPARRSDAALDRFADPSGKQTGRLMMAKDNREMLTTHDIVYIDLGSEDQVKTGDYLTIYRPLGTGNVTRVPFEPSTRNRSVGFQSDRYRGGGFSSQASRAKDSSASANSDGRYRGRPIPSQEVKQNRPLMPRKIVGELVVLDVQQRTATAVITRIAGEIHTGDWVEIQ